MLIREAASGVVLRVSWRWAKIRTDATARLRPLVSRETIRAATDPSVRGSVAEATARSAHSAVATNATAIKCRVRFIRVEQYSPFRQKLKDRSSDTGNTRRKGEGFAIDNYRACATGLCGSSRRLFNSVSLVYTPFS